jgi:hypothetical protein
MSLKFEGNNINFWLKFKIWFFSLQVDYLLGKQAFFGQTDSEVNG